MCACYVLNRSPSAHSSKTPFELTHGVAPDVSHFVPFWSPGVYHLTKEERHGTWDVKAGKCRMFFFSRPPAVF